MDVIPTSHLSISSYTNKKGEVKYQLSLTPEIMKKILEGDEKVLSYIKTKL